MSTQPQGEKRGFGQRGRDDKKGGQRGRFQKGISSSSDCKEKEKNGIQLPSLVD